MEKSNQAIDLTPVKLAGTRKEPEANDAEEEKAIKATEEIEIAELLAALREPIIDAMTEREAGKYAIMMAKVERKPATMAGLNLLTMQKEALINEIFRRNAKAKEQEQANTIAELTAQAKAHAKEKEEAKLAELARELAIRTYGLQRIGSEYLNDDLKDFTKEIVEGLSLKFDCEYHEGKPFSYHLGGYIAERGWGLTLVAYGVSIEHVNLKKDFGWRLFTLSWDYDKTSGCLMPKDAYVGFCKPLSAEFTAKLYPLLLPHLSRKQPESAPLPALKH